MVKGQFQIMQMMIMIIGVIFFFVLVALFIINIQYQDVADSYKEMQREQTISMIETLTNSPEFSCSATESWCIDEDKVNIMLTNFSEKYRDIWQISSIEILKIYPNNQTKVIECPNENCNYYNIYNTSQKNIQSYSAYVSMCQKNSRTSTSCSLVKFILCVKNV